MVGPESILLCISGSGWWCCNGVGDIFLAHCEPLSPNKDYLKSTAYQSIDADHIYPLWLQSAHYLMAASSRIIKHVRKHRSPQTGFLISNDPHSHQISIQERTFGMLLNRRFSSWMCNCMMLSCHHHVKSMMWKINSVLKPKEVSTCMRNVYQMKCLVSLYVRVGRLYSFAFMSRLTIIGDSVL